MNRRTSKVTDSRWKRTLARSLHVRKSSHVETETLNGGSIQRLVEQSRFAAGEESGWAMGWGHWVRCFGWFHPAGQVRLNRVRALLRLAPVLSEAKQQAWKIPEALLPQPPEPPPAPSPPTPPLCPCCKKPMHFLRRWQAGQAPPPVPWPTPASWPRPP